MFLQNVITDFSISNTIRRAIGVRPSFRLEFFFRSSPPQSSSAYASAVGYFLGRHRSSVTAVSSGEFTSPAAKTFYPIRSTYCLSLIRAGPGLTVSRVSPPRRRYFINLMRGWRYNRDFSPSPIRSTGRATVARGCKTDKTA